MSRRRNWRTRGGFTRGSETIASRGMGVNETLRRLHEIGEHVVQAAKAALKEGVDELVTDAKSRCPVRTGKLRDSIKAEPNRDGTVYTISANAQNNGYCYGQEVEFSPKECFHPFLYPALEAHRLPIRNKIDAAIERAIRRG